MLYWQVVSLLVKKIFFVLFFLFLFSFGVSALSEGDVCAKAAVVVDSSTMQVLFEKNKDEKLSMASTTKIMTCLLAVEHGKLDETVEITQKMCGSEGTSIGLKSGYKITLKNLLYGLMLESGNDAADAVAVFIAGSKENFARMMNTKAKEIGMKGTNFVTPSGLDDENHYTTAYDMALLGAYAVKNSDFLNICSTKTMRVDFISPDITVTFSNHNRLLRSYDGALGIKTGFTKKSGRCLVSYAEKNSVGLVAVTLKDPDDWNDHRKMLDYGFSMYETQKVYMRFPKELCLVSSYKDKIKIEASSYPVEVTCKTNEKLTQYVRLKSFVYAPVKKGDTVGSVDIYANGRLLKTVALVSAENAESIPSTYKPKRSIISYIKQKLNEMFR